jgi:hypothetical protein
MWTNLVLKLKKLCNKTKMDRDIRILNNWVAEHAERNPIAKEL